MVMDVIADGLRSEGYYVYKDPSTSRTVLQIRKGTASGYVDVYNILLDIATSDLDHTRFDEQLTDSTYETVKITKILGVRVRVILSVFESTGDDRLQRLEEMTKTVENLRIQIYR